MMRRLLPVLLLLTFAFNPKTNAQITPTCGVPPPPGAESCQTSCVYCEFDGYMGINNGTPSGGNQVCGLITLHNDQWFGFVAASTCITINIATSNCEDGNGMQAAFFSACSGEAIVCNDGNGGGEGLPLELSYCGFEPGLTYYLMVDGWVGDVCNYTIEVLSGSITPPVPGFPQTISGPTNVCPGATAVYSIPQVDNASFYHWTAPPGSSINGASNNINIPAPGGQQVTITYGTQGGQLCVGAANACFPEHKTCLPITNIPIPPTVKPTKIVCFEDRPFQWDEAPFTVLGTTGTYNLTSMPYDSYLGCDSFVKQTVIIKQQVKTNIGLQNICEGTCFKMNENTYCQSGGPFYEFFLSYQDCDSIVEFSVNVVPAVAVIAPVVQIDCANPTLTLNANGSTSNPNTSYQWLNSTGTQLGTALTQVVHAGGIYRFIVSNASGIVTCRDTATMNVPQNTTPPGASATGGTLTCVAPAVALEANSGTSGVNYAWNGPGISAANKNQQNPIVNQPGNYTVVVTNPQNSCTSSAIASVVADTLRPAATAIGGMLTCVQTSIVVDGGTNISNVVWAWFGPGIHTANQSLENPSVVQPGAYTVTVTNINNGCSHTASTTVTQDIAVPYVSAGPNKIITCLSTTVVLEGSSSGTNGAIVQYLWTGSGITTSNQTLPNPVVNQPGSYILVANNLDNGCAARDTVLVDADVTPPVADAGADTLINCSHPTVTLGGTNSSQGANFIVTWSGAGIFSGNENQLHPVVNQPDQQYALTVTNTVNGCKSVDFVGVDLNVDPPAATAGQDQILTCSQPNGLVLAGAGSPVGVQFLWNGPGIGANNATEQTPTITQPGNYTLLVTNPVNGCTAADAVFIVQDAALPNANAGQDQSLNCTTKMVNLDGSGSSIGPGISYLWSGPDMNPTNQTDLNPAGIVTAGTYYLTVTNSANNCVNTDVVVVLLDTLAPQADAGPTRVLNCYNNQQSTLNASASSAGAKFTYGWNGPAITTANQSQQNPGINLPGLYVLTVTNTDNTCTATSQVVVSENIAVPIADAGADPTIDCVVTSAPIGGNSSSGAIFAYAWSGPGLDSLQKIQPHPTVMAPGNYTLLVTNTENGCTATDDVTVLSTAIFPTASAGPDGLLTCANPNATLDGSASSSGNNFQVLWSGPGISAPSEAQESPSISFAGLYFLKITDTTNRCVAYDTVEVLENKVAPVAAAPASLHLDCQKTSVLLDGSPSSTGPIFTYLWQGPGITPVNETNLSPSVTQPGNYNLLVSNTENGCSTIALTPVTQDTIAPVANAGADKTITCVNTTQTLNGTGSSAGAIFNFVWQGPGINTSNYKLKSPVVADSGAYLLTVTNGQNHCTATDEVLVGQNTELPVTNAGPDRTLTCAVTSVQLDGAQSATGADISYTWSGTGLAAGEETKVNPSAIQPGIYKLTVTNSLNGCTQSDAVEVAKDIAPPTANAGPDLPLTCANSTTGVALSSAGSSTGANFTLLWEGPGITPANQNQPGTIVTAIGTYVLIITNIQNGCIHTDSTSVVQDQNVPTANAGPNQTLNCSVLQISLDGSASTDLGGGINYLWSGPDITPANQADERPTITKSGTYIITVQNSLTGCMAVDDVIVALDNQPPVVAINTDIITCAEPSGDLSVATTPALGCTYDWAGPDISSSNIHSAAFKVSEPGIYSVTVTAPNGCTNTATATMDVDANFPSGSAEGTTLNCANNSQSVLSGLVNTPGAMFEWLGPNGFTAGTLTVAVTQPGLYTLLITSPNGCKRAIKVNVLTDYQAPVVQLSVDKKLTCNVPALTIGTAGTSADSHFIYQWTSPNGRIVSGANSLSPVVNKAGDYTLIVTDLLNGCTNSATIAVEYDPSVPSAFRLDVRDVRCFGENNGSLTILDVNGGTQPFVYTLGGSAGTLNNKFTKLSPGTYVLSLEDANGCVLDSTLIILEPEPLVLELGSDMEVQLGDSVTVAANLTYSTPLASVEWNYAPNCDTASFCTEFTYLPVQSYRHKLTVRDFNGCSATDVVAVNVQKDRLIYVPNIFTPNSTDPDNFQLMVYGGKGVVKVRQWQIFDRWGEAVFVVRNFLPSDPNAAWNGKVRGEMGAAAVYVWMAEVEFADGEVETFKGDVTLVR